MASSSVFNIAINIFASPHEAFRAIEERPRFWFPLIFLLPGVFAVTFFFMLGVDLQFFFEEQLRASQPDLSETELEQATGFMGNLPQGVVATLIGLSGMIGLLLVLLLQAFYLK
ncbi:MAG: hypothetical protein R3305_10080, partial [Gammaproteobacteria bacterium]|nr:hypothetical protein [Gammaproteobacteria bacterium]